MKKLSSVLALMAIVGLVLVTGCKKEEAPPTPPEAPAAPTNNPAGP